MINSTQTFASLFSGVKPIIACIHLFPLPGSPLYDGNIKRVYKKALAELEIFKKHKVDAIIIENFRDKPFYPGRVPAETIAALAAISREIINNCDISVGINVLRNDAESAIAIAAAVEADFIRVNAHMNAIVSEQGIIEGVSHQTMRLRNTLLSKALVFADVGVKHAAPLADRGLYIETKDLCDRGLVDTIIVSGALTGVEANLDELKLVKKTSSVPVIMGSGITSENLDKFYSLADGFIIGSYFKYDGKGNNDVEESRVKTLMDKIHRLRA